MPRGGLGRSLGLGRLHVHFVSFVINGDLQLHGGFLTVQPMGGLDRYTAFGAHARELIKRT